MIKIIVVKEFLSSSILGLLFFIEKLPYSDKINEIFYNEDPVLLLPTNKIIHSLCFCLV